MNVILPRPKNNFSDFEGPSSVSKIRKKLCNLGKLSRSNLNDFAFINGFILHMFLNVSYEKAAG